MGFETGDLICTVEDDASGHPDMGWVEMQPQWLEDRLGHCSLGHERWPCLARLKSRTETHLPCAHTGSCGAEREKPERLPGSGFE